MPLQKENAAVPPAELAQLLSTALLRERIIPRFVDSYVIEHGRHALQVHAGLYRDRLGLLQREALLAATVRALQIACVEPRAATKSKQRRQIRSRKSPMTRPMTRQDATIFRRKFLAMLTRQHKWTAGDALDFQTDLQRYEELLARNSSPRRARKPFETTNHPFVDRCAFLLDSSFMEKARLAASKALGDIEELAADVISALAEQAKRPREDR